jgi:hypothetical protein
MEGACFHPCPQAYKKTVGIKDQGHALSSNGKLMVITKTAKAQVTSG